MTDELRPLPYYKWHWQDWRANRTVQRMSYIERGIYRELLDECWSEGFIPSSIDKMADIVGCPSDVMADAWQVLSKCFVDAGEGRLINERLNIERTVKDSQRVTRAINGQKGGQAKSLNEKENEASAKQVPSKCHIEEKRREEKSKEKERREEGEKTLCTPSGALVVFQHWQAVMKKPRTVFDGKRMALINARIKDGYTVQDLQDAATGCSLSPFHMGLNEKGTKYDGIDLIYRDAAHVEKFMECKANPPKPMTPSDMRSAVNQKQLDDWASSTGNVIEGDFNHA